MWRLVFFMHVRIVNILEHFLTHARMQVTQSVHRGLKRKQDACVEPGGISPEKRCKELVDGNKGNEPWDMLAIQKFLTDHPTFSKNQRHSHRLFLCRRNIENFTKRQTKHRDTRSSLIRQLQSDLPFETTEEGGSPRVYENVRDVTYWTFRDLMVKSGDFVGVTELDNWKANEDSGLEDDLESHIDFCESLAQWIDEVYTRRATLHSLLKSHSFGLFLLLPDWLGKVGLCRFLSLLFCVWCTSIHTNGHSRKKFLSFVVIHSLNCP